MHDVQIIDWEDVLPVTDVNLIFYSFHATISDVIEKHDPLRKLSLRQVRLLAKPWITTMENSKLSNPHAIANTFNNYFSTVASNVANSIPIVKTRIVTFLNAPLFHSFVLFPASNVEIEDEINKLNSSNSGGPFSIPTKLLKTLRFLLSGH